MSSAEVTSARSASPEACPECDASASVASDLHKYQAACTCQPAATYARAQEPGPAKPAAPPARPPALPPRPPPSARPARNHASLGSCGPAPASPRRKYAWWCVGCGALAAALGGLLAAAHILLRAHTASPHLLETVPAAVPAAMLVLTGLCIMSLARRRNRYSYMIKVVGACCLVCALTCVLVTITTTVIHMNKLQTLKFCEYTKLTRTCTCYSMPPDNQHLQEDEGVRCVFEGVADCGVVHGVLYWCLRGVFALSVTAVLVCIFSCMLAYQLLSHERKKMYWEQLELRCRSLYRAPAGHASAGHAPAGQPAAGRAAQGCSCCAQCRAPPAWDVSLQHRFWAPGRIGNLYSPNPGSARKNSAWSWFPWPRTSQNSRCRRMGIPQSGDSAYGFCDTDQPPQPPNQPYEDRAYQQTYPGTQNQTSGDFGQAANFGQGGSFGQGVNFGQSGTFGQNFSDSGGSYDHQTGVWGPPPPYSPQGRSASRPPLPPPDPAAAALLHHHHIDIHRNSMPLHDHLGSNLAIQNLHTCSRNSSYIPHNMMHQNEIATEMARINPELVRLNPELVRLNPELVRLNPELVRLNPELVRLNPDLARMNPNVYPQEMQEMVRLQELSGPESRFSTLRGHLVPYPACHRSLGMSVGDLHRDCRLPEQTIGMECLHQKSASKVSDQSSDSCQKQGKENLGFQNDKHPSMRASMQDCHRNNAESEVYFADVSSCCNVSVKADCCMNPDVSALVGTIENHPESTSESDSGSFSRQPRPPQPLGTKRRPRNHPAPSLKHQDKHRDLNNISRENQFQQMNLNESISQQNSIRLNELNLSSRLNDSTHSRMSDANHRMNDSSHSRNDSAHSRINDTINRLNDSTHSSHHSRMSDSNHRMNDSRLSDLNSSKRLEALRNFHPRQSSTDSNMSLKNNPEFVKNNLEFHKNIPEFSKNNPEFNLANPEFFVPPPPSVPLTPGAEQSAPPAGPDGESGGRMRPDAARHQHCHSDTNTMDSGWHSGEDKPVTD